MIEITARHMEGGNANEHIAEVRYKGSDSKTSTATRQAMVDWLDKSKSNKAIVYSRDRRSNSFVGVVHRQNAPDYIRTHADGQWNDNLLSLPTY
jgi:hypothetical protein